MKSKDIKVKGLYSIARGKDCSVKAKPLHERDASIYFIAGLLDSNKKQSNKYIKHGEDILKSKLAQTR